MQLICIWYHSQPCTYEIGDCKLAIGWRTFDWYGSIVTLCQRGPSSPEVAAYLKMEDRYWIWMPANGERKMWHGLVVWSALCRYLPLTNLGSKLSFVLWMVTFKGRSQDVINHIWLIHIYKSSVTREKQALKTTSVFILRCDAVVSMSSTIYDSQNSNNPPIVIICSGSEKQFRCCNLSTEQDAMLLL